MQKKKLHIVPVPVGIPKHDARRSDIQLSGEQPDVHQEEADWRGDDEHGRPWQGQQQHSC